MARVGASTKGRTTHCSGRGTRAHSGDSSITVKSVMRVVFVHVYDLMIKAYKEAREKRTIPATFDAFTGFCEIFVNREASAAMRQPSAEHKT